MSRTIDWIGQLCNWLNYSEQGFITKMVVQYVMVGAVISGIERSMKAKKCSETEDRFDITVIAIFVAMVWPLYVSVFMLMGISDFVKSICDNEIERQPKKSNTTNPNTDDFALVVRCKNCQWRSKHPEHGTCTRGMFGLNEDGFCSYGRRKDDKEGEA